VFSGCITVLPKQKPVGLYQFEARSSGPAPLSADAARVPVQLSVAALPVAVRGDGILTMNGDEAAYVAGARWVAPAGQLFPEAVLAGIERSAPQLRLVKTGEAGAASLKLRVAVRRFETQFRPTDRRTPVVHLVALVSVGESEGAAPLAEKLVDVSVPASANRVSAIVTAYDLALGQLCDQAGAVTLSSARAKPR
jgi:cholesterol transport system auxiliary component